MGTPYKFGSKSGNTKSFDCSSFTQYLFEQAGISIPRSSKEQSTFGTYVPRSELKPGDLVFFYSPVHHVALYIGNGKILHTYGEPGVTINDLNSGWWDEHYTTARRVIKQ
ncbi:NlpC/P60 family protein [Paenibacillus ginsengarvi]|uniref:NlpC/P60 family protein n=1 Tax=Paenibacillus ginsengarvi TaxID=400777 RepID=A0A3B0CID3_9BACL|nr:NlpC/P60 family protein [Paenibacillus ginsengarvi]